MLDQRFPEVRTFQQHQIKDLRLVQVELARLRGQLALAMDSFLSTATSLQQVEQSVQELSSREFWK